MPPEPSPAAAYEAHRAHLFGLAYRMLGTRADAEEVVQDAFAKMLEVRPADSPGGALPWLRTVTARKAIDRLRARKARPYVGTWLPGVVETGPEGDALGQSLVVESHPEARYGMRESATLAFLLAVEVLPPKQRAALVLRDVFDLSVRETAEALGMSASDVKMSHLRARASLGERDFDAASSASVGDARRAQTNDAILRFFSALAARDRAAMEAVLREDVEMRNDGGGEFFAARKPVVGRERVITFHLRVREPGAALRFRLTELNGLPAVLLTFPGAKGKLAVHTSASLVVDAEGRIARVLSVLATEKLRGVAFPPNDRA